MSQEETPDAGNVAQLMLTQLRRIDERTVTLMELFLRQDERLGRLERDMGELRRDMGEVRRDIGEIRSEMVLLENRMITQVQRVLNEFLRLEDLAFSKSGA